ncbi:MAG: anthranilate synthase component I family protein [Planctomycetes bacterium]|nr:anthranilate synthase component I family protein [Planctomycetota bacterium]MCW8136416.1 anthranilate synthase component I family protein [Planctomycetota bacterium]
MTATTIADLETPTSLFLKLRDFRPAFLLESVTHGERVGRYSFIGLDPVRTIEHRHGSLRELITRELAALSAARGTVASRGDSPLGLFGAIAYENVHEFVPTGVGVTADQRRTPNAEHRTLPLAAFVVPRAVVTFDHVTRRITLDHADGPQAAAILLQQVRQAMTLPLPALHGGSYTEPRATVAPEEFFARVARAKEHIAAGDIFQVVLSLAFEGETDLHPYQVYRALRHLNPSPYLYYFDFGGYQIIGSSPEALVKLDHGRLTIRPIAGTRPRGDNETLDAALEAELAADAKELAEHNMLVDLARNDVGRVAEIGSVAVPDLRVIERYSHVMHLVSRVTGRLRDGVTPLQAYAAAFPAGTVSGAPKIRALQIIDELEDRPRGFYAGSVGYFSAAGDFDQAITIRTIVIHNGRYSAQAGAGIVADSVPENEYAEIQNKAAALLKSLKFAKEEL